MEDYEIGYVRPSFISAFSRPIPKGNIKKLLAVANPLNKNFGMKPLDGSVKEVKSMDSILHFKSDEKNIAVGSQTKDEPTEKWVTDNIKNNKYEMIYFATHGMPHSNTIATLAPALKAKKLNADWQRRIKIRNDNLKGNSPLNGFLYFSTEGNDDILKGEIPTNQDGLLTIKEIMELPKSSFDAMRYVILSACNTGVTFAPVALKDDLTSIYDQEEIKKELTAQGWVPGIDQVSFVDIFMRRGIPNVYGTLWFANDDMSAELLSRFLKHLSEPDSDAIYALSEAQRDLIKMGKAKASTIPDFAYPQHPYLWAMGAMFGK